jgi:hypothetical protein
VSILRTILPLNLLFAVVFGVGSSEVFAQATSVTLQLFPFTGEVRLLNHNPDPFSFISYSLKSPSGGFNGANGVWTSIADTYDVSGNGFIDPIDDWIELDASATKLTEVDFIPVSVGTLPANRSVSLGRIWNPNVAPFEEIDWQIILPNGSDATVLKREAIDGDYFTDLIVDEADYLFWKTFFGSTTAYYADGNIDGIVDAADYTVWRDNVGLSLPGSGDGELGAAGGGLAAVAVPEPAALILAIAAGGWMLTQARRRRSAVS